MPNLMDHKRLLNLCWQIITAPEHRSRVARVVLLDFLNSAARLGGPYLISTSVKALENGEEGALQKIIAMAILMASGQLFPAIRAFLAEPLKFPLPRRLATDVINNYLHALEDNEKLEGIIAFVLGPYETTVEIIPTLLEDFAALVEMLTAGIFIGYVINPAFAVVFAFIIGINLAISMAYSKRVSEAVERQMQIGPKARGRLEGALERRKLAWIFNRDEFVEAVASITEYENGYIPARILQDQVIFAQKLLITLGFMGTLLWSAFQVQKGSYPAALFLGLLFYLMQLITPLSTLTQSVKLFNTAAKQVDVIKRRLQKYPQKIDRPTSIPLSLGAEEPITIEFKKVGFDYPDKPSVFKNLNCKIEPGLNLIVGKNGCGKSTLTKLLFGTIDLTAGNISINGQNTANCTSASILANIAFVPQGGMIPRGKIREILCYALPKGSKCTDDELRSVLGRVGLEKWTPDSPEKLNLDTEIGGQAEGASGGQFQKIAIARALMRTDARIIIFDEPETALDEETQTIIKTILATMKEAGKTIIVVSHASGEGSISAMADRVFDLSSLQANLEPSHSAFAFATGPDDTFNLCQHDGLNNEPVLA